MVQKTSMLTQSELKNIAVLLQRVNLTGAEALAVAQLQAKVNSLIEKEEPKTETPTSE